MTSTSTPNQEDVGVPAKPKRKRAKPQTAHRAIRLLRGVGYSHVHSVERWNPHVRVRQDFAGFADILAFGHRTSPGVAAAQACGATDLQPHITKLQASQAANAWVAGGNRLFLIQVLRKKMFRGSQRSVWKYKTFEFVYDPTAGIVRHVPADAFFALAESRLENDGSEAQDQVSS